MVEFDECVAAFMQEYGFTATFLQAVSSYDPSTGENTETVTEIAVEALQMDLPLYKYGASTQTGTLIQDGDKLLYIRPPNKVDPAQPALVVNPASDKVRIGTTEWRIVTSKDYNPSTTNQMLIELYIRH